MPAMLDDPTAPAIYRTSGQPPYPEPYGALPPDIVPRQVTLRDRVTTASLVPFSSPNQVPPHLTAYLCELLNREIEKGDTYPMIEPMALSSFGTYWFANFGAVMVLGDVQEIEEITQMEERGADWSKQCLGSFYVKPNYPGRSSHVCNGGFLVTDAARNRGVGRLMGEGYLEWAPKLGYTYSVFNLVYETNVASLRIWDALGFKRIGRVKGCGNLKSFPDQLIDAIMFGRELGGDGDEYITEERFDKIRFYLKNGSYPGGADRAEKSRLRSAATHYRLIPNTDGTGEDDKLMLKGKEVISDPHKQYEIARNMHAVSHGGINKTTASIAEKYHWVRIKETVSAAIRNCPECKDTVTKASQTSTPRRSTITSKAGNSGTRSRATVKASADPTADVIAGASLQQMQPQPSPASYQNSLQQEADHMAQQQQTAPTAHMQAGNHDLDFGGMPVDPRLQGMEWTSTHQSQIQMGANGSETSHAQEGASNHHDDVDARLREQFQAQIMSGDQPSQTYSQESQRMGEW